MRTLRSIGLAALLTLLASCAATGPKLSEVKATIPALGKDQGRIYFYRTKNFIGAAIAADLYLNGDAVGRSTRGSFFFVDRPPGNYEVTASTETKKKATFALSEGETKYVRTYVGIGILVGRIIPELVNADDAEKDMVDLAYVESAIK